MKTHVLTMSIAIGVSLAPTVAFAQRHIWGELGTQHIRLGNGQTWDDTGYGAGFDLMLGGRAQRGGGLLLVIGDEIRSGGDLKFLDNLAFVDLGIRVKNFSAGPGVNFVIVARPDVIDSRCKLSGAALQQFQQAFANGNRSTCVNLEIGTRSIGAVSGLGVSGFTRLTFGPRANGFLEARFIKFSQGDLKAEDTRHENISNQYPETDSAWDGRVTAGYTFGSALLRVQYVGRDFKFKRQFANNTDMFNESARQLTAGLGLTF